MIDGFKTYLSNLAFLIDQEGERTDVEFTWTSPLSGRGGRFFILPGLLKEQAMATFLYAALLRQLAHQTLDDMLGTSPAAAASGSAPMEGEARATAAAEVAALLRQAAGVFRFLSNELLPSLLGKLKGDRPGEVMSPTSEALHLVCLGEAQALAAFRAAERGSGPSLVASLQCGAGELFEKAAKALRDGTGDHCQFSDRLKRFVALSSSLSTARAHKHHAAHLMAQMAAGDAERSCQEAGGLLATCSAVAEVDASWKALLADEARDTEAKRARIEADRLYVYCQPLPREVPSLPGSKVLVSPVAYAVERTTQTAAELGLTSG